MRPRDTEGSIHKRKWRVGIKDQKAWKSYSVSNAIA